MDNIIFLIMSTAILIALIIVLIVVLKDGKLRISLKRDKKKDVLSLEAEHQLKQKLLK